MKPTQPNPNQTNAQVLNSYNNISVNIIASAKARKALGRSEAKRQNATRRRLERGRSQDDRNYIINRPLRESDVHDEVGIHQVRLLLVPSSHYYLSRLLLPHTQKTCTHAQRAVG